ncbi:conserved hypothetical protein [Candida dubliniensis CD36]|uniref:MICOS complex subunit n=1 Tax=Candida dubliniensis (strain CD36 / ATCC MYA-646 / CBS 7987 / NCPF 3949 / NRRL Y-17841) TaxID=573826 RepID=B9W9H6_CANDC|nr:conserved hypothetical protein [Candida dubliniensis CD36]CAX45459.1 conserved hypothetical protein [Candida dubliniensis CD36]
MVKRSFYEDDEYIINKPGTITAITPELAEQESIHGQATFINGMVIRSTPILEKYANSIRHYLHNKLSIWTAELNTQTSAFKNELTTINSEINSLIYEPILPNLIYILTMTLTGSIFVRQRNIVIRFITPIMFGGLSLKYFMPNTFKAIIGKYDNVEKENLPQLYEQRQELTKNLKQLKNDMDQGLENAQVGVYQAVHDFRKLVKEKWE